MNLLEQCQKWHEDGEYKKIIDALEEIPANQRTPEMDSELARAYNNMATFEKSESRTMYKKAISLLKPHAKYFNKDHFWNFRMGYAYCYLEQEGTALKYFEEALRALPDDKDTTAFIKHCKRRLELPRFKKNFSERVDEMWRLFQEEEAQLRHILDTDKDHCHGDELVAKCDDIFKSVFDNISFELGFTNNKYELILTPEGNKTKLFELMYIKKHAPASVLDKWNIQVGRLPMKDIGFRTDLQGEKHNLTGEDVQVWIDEKDGNDVKLTLYCEKLLPLLEDDEDNAFWLLYTLTDIILGDIASMYYISSISISKTPKEEPSFALTELSEKLEDMGLPSSPDPQTYLDNYTAYRMNSGDDAKGDWRTDIIVGSTCCPPLLNDYFDNDSYNVDQLHADGAVAGFFCYPLDGFSGDKRSDEIFAFRDSLEDFLMQQAGEDIFCLIGGATGIFCGYLDFIAWDLPKVLSIAKEFFENSNLPWADFHTFRHDTNSVCVMTHVSRESSAMN